MRLGSRLGLLSILSTLLPVAGLGIWTAESRYQNYFNNVADQQLTRSKSSSFYVDTWLSSRKNQILSHGSFMNQQIGEERERTLYELLNEDKDIRIVGIFDESGLDALPHQSKADIDTKQFLQFREQIKQKIDNKRSGFSDVYGSSNSFLYVHRLPDSEYLAVEFSLESLESTLMRQSEEGMNLFLISQTKGKVVGEQSELSPELMLRRCASKNDSHKVQYSSTLGNSVLASCSVIEEAPWIVVVGTDMSFFDETGRDIWLSTFIVSTLACCISLLLSALFIRRLTEPMERLVEAARTIAMGGFGQRVYYHRNDEIGELADAFNMMSLALNQYSNDFQRQAEILSLTNAELQNRVDERTKELEEAQQKLIQSARLAAVGEMGAGLAHSLNNPLSAVLGSVQLLEITYPDEDLFEMIRDETKRCKEIVLRWLEASQSLDKVSNRLTEEISLRDVVRRSSKTVSTYLMQRDVLVETSDVQDFIFWGDPRIIEQAFTQLMYGLRPYVEKGNNIRLKSFVQPSLVAVQILYKESYLSDDERKAAGMFYWTAIHYFSTHQIEVKEVKDKEYQWIIHIPKGRKENE